MPGIARKLVVCAAVDGLIVQPLPSKGQRPFQPVRVRYGDAAISAVSRDQVPDASKPGSSFEAFGVVGEAHECIISGAAAATDASHAVQAS